MKSTINIAIVDDHILVRDGLISQLTPYPQIVIIMQAIHGLDMIQQLEQATVLPDIAVIDLNMPVMDGFTLAGELQKHYPQIRILVLSAYHSKYNVMVMINNGVRGYLSKQCHRDEFVDAIHAIYETGYYYSELFNEHTVKMFQNIRSAGLSERQLEFLKLCCSDKRYDQIAAEMGISMHTLEGHRDRLFTRLGVTSRNALIVFAMQSGIVNDTYHPDNFKPKL